MSTNKLCIGTLNAEYIPGAISFFNSLLYNNKNFNLPFLIYIWDDYDYSFLTKIYSNIKFKKILLKPQSNIKNKFREWNYNVFVKLELFKEINYDLIYFFDFDIIVNSNIDDFFSLKCDFGAVKAPICSYKYLFNVDDYFDAGVLIIGKKYINLETYNRLKELSLKKEWAGNEPLLNDFFYKKTTFLSKKFNTLTVDTIENINDSSVFQYVGSQKPWHEGAFSKKYTNKALRNNSILTINKLQSLYNFYASLKNINS